MPDLIKHVHVRPPFRAWNGREESFRDRTLNATPSHHALAYLNTYIYIAYIYKVHTCHDSPLNRKSYSSSLPLILYCGILRKRIYSKRQTQEHIHIAKPPPPPHNRSKFPQTEWIQIPVPLVVNKVLLNDSFDMLYHNALV